VTMKWAFPDFTKKMIPYALFLAGGVGVCFVGVFCIWGILVATKKGPFA